MFLQARAALKRVEDRHMPEESPLSPKQKDFVERYNRFRLKWRLEPSSYQIRNHDGTPGGWIAQVHIWREDYHSLTVQPLVEKNMRVHATADDANAVALWMGLHWLEAKADPDPAEST